MLSAAKLNQRKRTVGTVERINHCCEASLEIEKMVYKRHEHHTPMRELLAAKALALLGKDWATCAHCANTAKHAPNMLMHSPVNQQVESTM